VSEIERLPLTKIIATVGPACAEPAVLERVIEAGATILRVNFGHGTLNDHARTAFAARSIATRLGRVVALLGDLQGPKIRLRGAPDAGVEVRTGETVVFTRDVATGAACGGDHRFTCTYDRLIDDVKPGERILLNDGAVRMLVVEVSGDWFRCAVSSGGRVSNGKGINLPESRLTAPALGEHDERCVRWAAENGIDILALSFARGEAEVVALRALVERIGAEYPHGYRPAIVAKIESPSAVANVEAILDAADGIMVARGDLGVEVELARVPVIQKQLIESAQRRGKPCIVATQMLESMIHAPSPTRAEVSDVANAILAGVDAVMLSAETAAGRFPALAVEHMRLIALRTEAYLAAQPQSPRSPAAHRGAAHRTASLAHGVATIAIDFGARAIAIWSQQGGGARALACLDTAIPIMAMSTDVHALARMQLLRGVTPVLAPAPADAAGLARFVERWLLEHGWLAPESGESFILVAGSPIGAARSTNALSIHTVGGASSVSSSR
jgi:pyruvate kinase